MMFLKIKYIFEERGLSGVISSGINSLLTRFFGVRIARASSVAGNRVARKVFSKCRLKYSEDGFHFLEPMPTGDELTAYYSSLYWNSRSGKNYGVNTRDIIHYQILKEYIPDILVKGKAFLNIGAGHGGISNLCWLQGMQIINVEPSLVPQFYSERWVSLEDICQVRSHSVDMVYGSHSLEHVQDIDVFQKEVRRVLKPNGYVFWEVPNADWPLTGAQRGKVDIPHTYYFQRKFFEKWFSEIILCGGFEQSHRFDVIEDWKSYEDSKGEVIRALGKIG